MLASLCAIPAYGGLGFGAIFMVAKRFWMWGCRPGFNRSSSQLDAPSFCVVITIGLLANLMRLGSILWGKIKRHVISDVFGRCLAIRRGPVNFTTGLKVR